MRGKHATAARNRREHEELGQRAATAEQQAEKLAGELAQLRDSTDQRIASLQADLKQVREQRDAGVAPKLDEAVARAERMRRERDAARRQCSTLPRRIGAEQAKCAPAFREAGLTHDQIAAVLKILRDRGHMYVAGLEVDLARLQSQQNRR